MDAEAIAGWDLRYSTNDRCATRNGGQLYFERHGSGPALVLVNNFFTIAPSWRNFTKNLYGQCSILAYDLQNQGASSQPGPDFLFTEHVEDLIDLLDHLEIADAYLLGTSISTLIVRDVARIYPDRVRGLVLVGPAFSPFGDFRLTMLLKDWRKRLEQGGPRLLFDYLYPLVFSDRGIEAGGRPAYLALRERFLAVNSHEQIEACLAGAGAMIQDPTVHGLVNQPVLILIGDGDYLWSESTIDGTGVMLPRREGVVLAEAGHLPFLEQTALFESAIATFVTKHESNRAPTPAGRGANGTARD
jgi:pimeloyl-ACP methyl ester carboxylesterase